jgi:aspartate kinase
MLVFKFGGASISNIDRIKNVAEIIRSFSGNKILTIISAMGKTTNALEKVAEAFYAGRTDEALQLFARVKQQHLTTAKYLLVKEYLACETQLNDFFTEVEWLLHDKPVRGYDYYYDQIVCCGELLSTCIVSHFLTEEKIANNWVDVRDILRTDDNFREASLDWSYSAAQVDAQIKPLLEETGLVITQGFVGSTADNESTTFGREGSDYSAAIFANLLDAESQTIWKDVPSVMNADPKEFPNAVPMHELSYDEVIEMAYYGAQVIHPKTIKPLYEKKIPLVVKCFLDPALPGTVISNRSVKNLPPVIIRKQNQTLIIYKAKDYSFVAENSVRHLYQIMESLHIKPNMTQIGAINFTALYDGREDKIQQLASEAEQVFDVQIRTGLTMLTIRHYNSQIIEELLQGQQQLLVQQTPHTIQVVCQAIA